MRPKLTRKTLSAIATIVCCVLWLNACSQGPDDAQTADKKDKSRPAHAVEVITVSQRPMRITRTLTGTLEAPRTVHVHSERAGRIMELPFYEGDRVAAGAALVRLDDALIRAELDMAVATRKQAEVDLQRLQNLVPKKLASEDELARAHTALELARAAESLQRTQLSRTVIQAPFAGLISARLKELGDVVPLNEHILTLFDPGLITATVRVPEQLLSQVVVGDAVQVRIDSLGDRDFAGEVLRVHPMIDPATRQGTVEVRLQPVPAGARPGQLCRVSLATPEMPRRTIPLNALQYDAQGAHVYRLDEQTRTRRVGVRSGLQFGEQVEILEGLADGDRVVSKGFLGLRADSPVRVVNAATTDDKAAAEANSK
ncbi:MAG: efflux RND transporter periplasmic adaptor subunit [Gammaproteobacteria bacterium]|nr:efflux RND transporter periplasmic adaptor subunit [Gammaproteobacteria bacterium]